MKKLIWTFLAVLPFFSCFAQRNDFWETNSNDIKEITNIQVFPVSTGIDKTDTAKTKKQNFLYFTGSLPMVSGYYIAAFERELLTVNAGTLNLSAGYGGWSNWDNAGNVGLLSTHFISGKKKHHFETDIGLMFHNDKTNIEKNTYVKFNINAGYRIQQRGKPLVFRIGVGLPMGLYAGFGIAF